MANGSGFTAVELQTLGSKPRGDGVTPAWKYLKGAHESVQGILDGMTLVRRAAARGDEYRGRLARDQEDLLRAALIFTSSGLDACCKRLVRDAAPPLIQGNADAARKFDDFLRQELAGGPADELSAAIRSQTPREELVKLYVAAKTKASMQGDEDVRRRVRDTLGIPNSVLSKQRLQDLQPFFKARNDIVHDMDYVDTSGSSAKRHTRSMDWVREQCDQVFSVAKELIAGTATNLRKL